MLVPLPGPLSSPAPAFYAFCQGPRVRPARPPALPPRRLRPSRRAVSGPGRLLFPSGSSSFPLLPRHSPALPRPWSPSLRSVFSPRWFCLSLRSRLALAPRLCGLFPYPIGSLVFPSGRLFTPYLPLLSLSPGPVPSCLPLALPLGLLLCPLPSSPSLVLVSVPLSVLFPRLHSFFFPLSRLLPYLSLFLFVVVTSFTPLGVAWGRSFSPAPSCPSLPTSASVSFFFLSSPAVLRPLALVCVPFDLCPSAPSFLGSLLSWRLPGFLAPPLGLSSSRCRPVRGLSAPGRGSPSCGLARFAAFSIGFPLSTAAARPGWRVGHLPPSAYITCHFCPQSLPRDPLLPLWRLMVLSYVGGIPPSPPALGLRVSSSLAFAGFPCPSPALPSPSACPAPVALSLFLIVFFVSSAAFLLRLSPASPLRVLLSVCCAFLPPFFSCLCICALSPPLRVLFPSWPRVLAVAFLSVRLSPGQRPSRPRPPFPRLPSPAASCPYLSSAIPAPPLSPVHPPCSASPRWSCALFLSGRPLWSSSVWPSVVCPVWVVVPAASFSCLFRPSFSPAPFVAPALFPGVGALFVFSPLRLLPSTSPRYRFFLSFVVPLVSRFLRVLALPLPLSRTSASFPVFCARSCHPPFFFAPLCFPSVKRRSSSSPATLPLFWPTTRFLPVARLPAVLHTGPLRGPGGDRPSPMYAFSPLRFDSRAASALAHTEYISAVAGRAPVTFLLLCRFLVCVLCALSRPSSSASPYIKARLPPPFPRPSPIPPSFSLPPYCPPTFFLSTPPSPHPPLIHAPAVLPSSAPREIPRPPLFPPVSPLPLSSVFPFASPILPPLHCFCLPPTTTAPIPCISLSPSSPPLTSDLLPQPLTLLPPPLCLTDTLNICVPCAS
ncbi:hypothetical protein C7M84_024729 [Penaeus vannamei]|uniref:Uncharacterized protein n=1 Tax=Penaeus vannamei TaxID=6689 RepID=A0A3R7MHS4_PENVA|nr:hypothetical protein C7M84_024729 [Penaeus vannamei]